MPPCYLSCPLKDTALVQIDTSDRDAECLCDRAGPRGHSALAENAERLP
jgi:hypothetical protein